MEKPRFLITGAKEFMHIAYSKEGRNRWLEGRIAKGLESQIITTTQADRLKSYSGEKACQRFLFDIAVVDPILTSLSLIGDIVYVPIWNRTEGDPSVMIPVTMATFFSTTVYTVMRSVSEIITEGRGAPTKARFFGGLVSLIKPASSLSLPAQAGLCYPEFGLLLATQASNAVTSKIRRFGAAGRFLSDRITQVNQGLINRFITVSSEPDVVNPDNFVNP